MRDDNENESYNIQTIGLETVGIPAVTVVPEDGKMIILRASNSY